MAVKKKTSKKRAKAANPHPKQVVASKPMSDTHKQLLSLVAKGMLAVETTAKQAAQAEKQMEQAYARAQKAAKQAKTTAQKMSGKAAKQARQTAKNVSRSAAGTVSRARSMTAKEAVAAARAQAKHAKDLWSNMRKGLKDEEKALNDAVRAAEAEKKREAAKQKAIKAFVAKWEREHKKRQVKRKPAKKKTSKKKATA
jgi:colicin import membrane protein